MRRGSARLGSQHLHPTSARRIAARGSRGARSRPAAQTAQMWRVGATVLHCYTTSAASGPSSLPSLNAPRGRATHSVTATAGAPLLACPSSPHSGAGPPTVSRHECLFLASGPALSDLSFFQPGRCRRRADTLADTNIPTGRSVVRQARPAIGPNGALFGNARALC